jgi:hypothetical protein
LDEVAPNTPPVIVPIVQLKFVPVTVLVRGRLTAVALHIVVKPAVATLGEGLTVTTTLVAAPGHEFAVGVTMKVTDPAVVPELVSIWAIVAPDEAVAPVIPPETAPTVQLNVLPATLLNNAIFVVPALQIVVGPNVVTFGVGLTVTTMLTGRPEHEFAVGVTM